MALDYSRGDLLFEDDFTGGLGSWTKYEFDGKGSNSFATVETSGGDLRLYAQHDGSNASDDTSLPKDSLANIGYDQTFRKGAYVELEFEFSRNPTWTQVGEGGPKDPYTPGVSWGVLGSDGYGVFASDPNEDDNGPTPRNLPIEDGWTNRYGARRWGDPSYPTAHIANDREDDYRITTSINDIGSIPEGTVHHLECVAVDEEAQLQLTLGGGTTYEIKNTLADVIGASGYSFISGENIGIKTDSPDQSHLFVSGDEVALGPGGDYAFQSGSEIQTTESVAVSELNNRLFLENRVVNNFPNPPSPGWVEVLIKYVKVWEPVVN